jgi:hypothetical protein
MSDTAVLRRPGAEIQPSARDRLRAAIANFVEERERINGLEQGRDRAQDEQRQLRTELIEAERELASARHDEQVSTAYSYINREATDGGLLLAEKSAELDRIGRQIQRSEEVERAIAAEIEQAERRLRMRQRDLNEAMGDFLCSSPQCAELLNAVEAVWRHLRTLMVLGGEFITACRAYCPASIMSKLQIHETLQDNIVGFPLDPFIGEWRAAFAELAALNPDTQLPERSL